MLTGSSAAECTATIRAGLPPSPMLEALLAHQMWEEEACQKDLLQHIWRKAMQVRWHLVNQTQSRQQGRNARRLASELCHDEALGDLVSLEAMLHMPEWAFFLPSMCLQSSLSALLFPQWASLEFTVR